MWRDTLKRLRFLFILAVVGLLALVGQLAATSFFVYWLGATPAEVFADLLAGASRIALLTGAIILALGFTALIIGLQRESKDYARNISSRAQPLEERELPVPAAGGLAPKAQPRSSKKATAVLKDAPASLNVSNLGRLFQSSRQRLLDEAVRIDSISRRNLIIGIMFSIIALSILAWPLVAAAFSPRLDSTENFNVLTWAAQYYAPRFAVGLLLQFVGFFFLRLYVANELDLKHNKNEITNIELKMMGLELAKEFGDSASKKEIIKSLAATERNFIIKKNERSVSMEALAEYNDLKGIFEKLIAKIPGAK